MAASAAASATKFSSTKPGRGGSRRGRAKSFTDSRVQAAYERQRDLKATYQAVAHAIKPALQELAERSIEEALKEPDFFKTVPEYKPLVRQLQSKFDGRLAQHHRRLECDLNLAKATYDAELYVAEREFQVRLHAILIFFGHLRAVPGCNARACPKRSPTPFCLYPPPLLTLVSHPTRRTPSKTWKRNSMRAKKTESASCIRSIKRASLLM